MRDSPQIVNLNKIARMFVPKCSPKCNPKFSTTVLAVLAGFGDYTLFFINIAFPITSPLGGGFLDSIYITSRAQIT